MTNRRRAASIFELLMVIGIGLILVVIAFFSVRNLVVRTKVSRVKEEHRLVARAIQNYTLDHSLLPTQLTTLTHPTAYLGEVPFDPFQNAKISYLYLPSPAVDVPSLLISPGPNGRYDLPSELWAYVTTNVPKELIPPAAASRSALDASIGSNESGVNAEGAFPRMGEGDRAILSLYLNSFQYNPANGDAGDIITVVH